MTTTASPMPSLNLEAPLARARTDAWLWGAVAVFISAVYLLLLNPYWVRHGDSEAFISIARSLARGEGYRFNGQPVSTVPPGWPLALAVALKFTSKLLLLKLIPMLSIVTFLMISYSILCRFTQPLVAALCVVTSAMLNPVFSLSYMFFSDPFFALLCWVALWQAIRISEGSAPWWRIALVVVLMGAATAVRWTGPLWWLLIAGALLHGDVRVHFHRRWITALLSGVIVAAVFLGLRHGMRVDPSAIDPRYDAFLSGQYGILDDETVQATLSLRIAHSGMWISGLVALPVMQTRMTRDASNVMGWLLIAVMIVSIVAAVRRRRWIMLGVGIHLVVLFARWPSPLVRYIMLLSPLILWLIYDGITRCFSVLPARFGPVRTATLNAFFASVLLINGAMYLSEMVVMRNKHFYDRVEGGTQKALVDAAWFLNNLPKDQSYEVAISLRRMNFDREAVSGGYFRALNFLTNRSIVSVPYDDDNAKNLCREPDEEVIKWLKEHNVRFYLYQPPIRVIGHFAPLSREGIPITRGDTEWRLYEIVGDEARRVPLEPTEGWPRNVPGL